MFDKRADQYLNCVLKNLMTFSKREIKESTKDAMDATSPSMWKHQ